MQIIKLTPALLLVVLQYLTIKLNDGKTEFIIIGSRQQLAKVNIDHINVGTSDIRPVGSVQNLGLWFDRSMTMSSHVGKVCSKAFRGLYNICQIRKFFSEDSTKTLIHAFVTSHLDYCNSLLYGIPKYQLDRLQRVLNAAARLTCYVPRFNHITATLMELHGSQSNFVSTLKLLYWCLSLFMV